MGHEMCQERKADHFARTTEQTRVHQWLRKQVHKSRRCFCLSLFISDFTSKKNHPVLCGIPSGALQKSKAKIWITCQWTSQGLVHQVFCSVLECPSSHLLQADQDTLIFVEVYTSLWNGLLHAILKKIKKTILAWNLFWNCKVKKKSGKWMSVLRNRYYLRAI